MTIIGFNDGQQKQPFQAGQSLDNNSGQGTDSPVLDIVVKRFNWGAFGFSWIWGLCNKTYITLIVFPLALLGFIPVIGFIIQMGVLIWIGINGNKWAWQNKRWESIEQFHNVQRKWAIGYVIFSILLIILMVVFCFAYGFALLKSYPS